MVKICYRLEKWQLFYVTVILRHTQKPYRISGITSFALDIFSKTLATEGRDHEFNFVNYKFKGSIHVSVRSFTKQLVNLTVNLKCYRRIHSLAFAVCYYYNLLDISKVKFCNSTFINLPFMHVLFLFNIHSDKQDIFIKKSF